MVAKILAFVACQCLSIFQEAYKMGGYIRQVYVLGDTRKKLFQQIKNLDPYRITTF